MKKIMITLAFACWGLLSLAQYQDGKENMLPESDMRLNAESAREDYSGRWVTGFSNSVMRDSGYLRKGVPDGEWKVWYPDGRLRYVRTYSADKYRRVRMEMRTAHPKKVNYPLTDMYMRNRAVALGYMTPGYSFREEDYEAVFSKCLHDGLYMNYDAEGKVVDSGYYRNGLREGVWQMHTADGQLLRGHYKHGQRRGVWRSYDSSGKLVRVTEYSKRGDVWSKSF